jgi:hypothetical protein
VNKRMYYLCSKMDQNHWNFGPHNIPFEFPMPSNYKCFSLEVFKCFSSIGNVEVMLLIKLLPPSSLARYMYYIVSMYVKGLGVRVLELTSITQHSWNSSKLDKYGMVYVQSLHYSLVDTK